MNLKSSEAAHSSAFAFTGTLRLGVALAALGASVTLSGCASFTAGSTATVAQPVASIHLQGTVHGGQQPVVNARIRIYAAGAGGYGQGYTYASGTDLLGSNVVTTDQNGSFSVTNLYTCPTPTSTQVYVVAQGGNPIPGQAANPNLAMMAAVGPCNQQSAQTFIAINEVSTVAAVYALSPFMSGPAGVGTSATNPTGLNNAFAAVSKLVTLANGRCLGPRCPPVQRFRSQS